MFKLCTRLGWKILKAVNDVINDVTSDVIFHMKKLLLNPFLHIKGGKYEGSRFDTHERASSGLSKNLKNVFLFILFKNNLIYLDFGKDVNLLNLFITKTWLSVLFMIIWVILTYY